jgi:hypothetical protein
MQRHECCSAYVGGRLPREDIDMRKTLCALAIVLVPLGGVGLAQNDPDELVPCKIVVVKPNRLARAVCRPATDTTFVLPTFVPTDGSFRIRDLSSVVQEDFPLTLGTWTDLGDPGGSEGYRYKGSRQPGDPCRIVLIKPNVLKAVCRGEDVSLSVPFGGDAAVVFKPEYQDGAKRYCARFGGTPVRNDTVVFKRKNAAAPAVCSPAGAFLDVHSPL